ncbi:MAG: DegT/DnrJ/EryC1/StrS family aminotransferase [Nanoarchaeota archaeon]|nr:DegT/DnrJ/EryC1/StrS family aminotransferase [Nanoarchaeota archaeon]
MHSRLIPYTVPQLEQNTPFIILRDILRGDIKNGDSVKRLETFFAEYVGTKYAISFASARAALFYTYRFFFKCGQKIILPSYTCIPAIDSGRWEGLIPHFLDIDLNSYNPKFDERVRDVADIGAISLSYLYGLIGELNPFIEYATKAGIPIIEDAAIALGGTYQGKKVGSIGDAAVFSLQESKIITAWRGGIVTTNNKELYTFLMAIREKQCFLPSPKLVFNLSFSFKRKLFSWPHIYGLTMYPLKKLMTTKKLAPFLGQIMNFNPLESIDGRSPTLMPTTDQSRLSNIQASVALESMKHVNIITRKRRNLARMLSEELDGKAIFPEEHDGAKHAYGRFPIRIPGENKFKLYSYFLRRGIETSVNYPYICPETTFMTKYNFNAKNYPNASIASQETILLPFHTALGEEDINIIADAVRQYPKKRMTRCSRK